MNSSRVFRVVASLGLIAFSQSLDAAPPEWEAVMLADVIAPRVKAHDGQVAVAIKHLDSGASYAWRADEPMPTASLIKLPVMIAAYDQAAQGRLDLARRVAFEADDKVPGSGILGPHFSPGLKLTIRDSIHLMIVYSDNAATNLVLKEIALPTTNALMDQLGCPNTRVHAYVFKPDTSIAPERSKQFGLGSTTAHEMVGLLERLHRGQIVSTEASRAMLDHLAACDDKSRLNKLLPAGTKVALKTGSVNAVRTVAGIVTTPNGPFAVCVLTAGNKDQRWTDDNAGQVLSAQIAKAAYDVFNPAQPKASAFDGVLRSGAQGDLVQDLQRTLNKRLSPSPNLTVDGEYGPATQRVVQRLQKETGLRESGEVDSATWAALGPLVPGDDGFDPSSKQPSDETLTGPFVTCKAWIAGDPATGAIAGGERAEEPRDFASTTKIMTALIVLRYLERHPEAWDERLTMSQAADDTPGSTAAVRAGERVTIRDMLYGLMLPSGNDASVALAEHFGSRFVRVPDVADITPLELFIREMNRTAAELGMTTANYVNTHGLTHRDHKASPRDLFRLAAAALKQPGFRDLIQTRVHRGEAEGPGGYRRVLLWKNTNRLLDIEGYSGVKTGTTDAAGACLVSLSQRNGQEALAVVLGATSTDARYTDSRNIFRWYWSQAGGGGK
jgi:D-alanyl-D-alanine carboxypeptidase (penicillin-binding protein 5/6)